MKKLLVLSGKGGTGKTTVSGSLIILSNTKAFADCDVDAPNLHIISGDMGSAEKSDYSAFPVSAIDPKKCIGCGKCIKSCRFRAIVKNVNIYRIIPDACEGCGVCELVCPSDAVYEKIEPAGQLLLYRNKEKVFSTASLNIGQGTSGKLVVKVKDAMTDNASADADVAIIDGSPGIGCPVIASLSGVDAALIVTEPSLSGLNDLKRVLDTALKSDVRTAVCINKYDSNTEICVKIESYLNERNVPFVGRIPFDSEVSRAVNCGISIVQICCPAGAAIREMYPRIMALLDK